MGTNKSSPNSSPNPSDHIELTKFNTQPGQPGRPATCSNHMAKFVMPDAAEHIATKEDEMSPGNHNSGQNRNDLTCDMT